MDFVEKMRLRGKAEEDRFFAELDRQLIEAMHEKQKVEDEPQGLVQNPENKGSADK